jgi:hypothetical protein
MAVLGVIKGFNGLSSDMQNGVKTIGDSIFINTTYTFNTAVTSTYNYALKLIAKDGGEVTGSNIKVKTQLPVAPLNEVSFPDLVFDKKISVFDEKAWSFKGKWMAFEVNDRDNKPIKQSMFADKAGDEFEIVFSGTGISIEGNWYKDGGKADIYLDGTLNRSIDTYYDFANQQHTESIWHVLNLRPGDHKVRVVVKGEKRPESSGTRVYIVSATIFKTESKKNESYKFSFEK